MSWISRLLAGFQVIIVGRFWTIPEDAVAQLSKGIFAVPGPVVRGGGIYTLTSQSIDFRRTLAMRASLSKAAGGIKSLLLLPLDPFFKKDGTGAVVPVRIGGTYSHPVFKMSLTRKK
jgi:hypothetical protein